MISKNPPFNCAFPSYFGLMTTSKQPNHHQNDHRDCQKMGRLPQKGHVSEVFLELETFSKQERPTPWAIGIGNIVWWTSFFVVSCNIKKGLQFFSPWEPPPFFFSFFFVTTIKPLGSFVLLKVWVLGVFPVRTSMLTGRICSRQWPGNV